MTDSISTTAPKAVAKPTASEIRKQLQAELDLLKPHEKVVEEKSPQQIERERRIDSATEEFAGFASTVGDLLDGAPTEAMLGTVRNLRLARDKAIKAISEIEDAAIRIANPDGF